jgi:hypothetical protein
MGFIFTPPRKEFSTPIGINLMFLSINSHSVAVIQIIDVRLSLIVVSSKLLEM